METSELTLFSAMCESFCTAVEKARAEAMSLTDMYVQVKYDEQLFSVFDDTENILVQSVIDGLDEWRDSSGERSDAAIIAFLRKVLNHEDVNHALHSLDIIPPFSVVLVDNEMEPVADLITLDDENIYLHDDFWEKMDKELDELDTRMGFLASTGSVAPLVGLFGTVWGIINSFNAIAATQSNSLSAMAPGIAEALFTTAFGLIAAIPAVVAYNKISSDIDRFAKKLENFMAEFSSILSREIDDTAIKADMAGE